MSQPLLNAKTIQNIITSYNSKYIDFPKTNNKLNTLSSVNNYCMSFIDNYPYENFSYNHYIKKKKTIINNNHKTSNPGLIQNFHQKQIQMYISDYKSINKTITGTKEDEKLFVVNNIIYQNCLINDGIVINKVNSLKKELNDEYNHDFSDNRKQKMPLSKKKKIVNYLLSCFLGVALRGGKLLINIIIIVLIFVLISFI